MRVLVTNDDGIGAPGIAALAAALGEAGHTPVVAAPAEDMSGASASIMRMHPDAHVEVARADLGSDGIEAWCVDATPALAVLAGTLGAFGEPPDVVVSGINAGLNTGLSVRELELPSDVKGQGRPGLESSVEPLPSSLPVHVGERQRAQSTTR